MRPLRPDLVELAHQQAGPAQGGGMVPQSLAVGDHDGRPIAGHVADLDAVLSDPPRKAAAVAREGKPAPGRPVEIVREAADHGGTRDRDEAEIEHRTRLNLHGEDIAALLERRDPRPLQGGMAVGHRRQRSGLAAARPIAE